MQLTTAQPAMQGAAALEALLLQPADAPGFRRLFIDSQASTNEVLAERAADPAMRLRTLTEWGRIDGCAARFVSGTKQRVATAPLVIDSSAARFIRSSGALQALNDEAAFPNSPASFRLFCRNIADNTECVREFFEEDGVQFVLYRVDFRVATMLGSVGAVWRWPYGSPLDALKLAERQSERIHSTLSAGAAARDFALAASGAPR